MAIKRRKDDDGPPPAGQNKAAKKAHVKPRAPVEAASENFGKKATPTPSAEIDGAEPDFPRGGASALTPAEVREACLQAEAEFQQETTKKPKKGNKGQQKSNAASSTGVDEPLFGVDGIVGKLPTSAEILRYKSLSVGWKIWGAVAEVNHRDLIVSLPGGLRGFVQIEEASDVLAEMLKENGKSKKATAKKLKRKEKEDSVKETENGDDDDDSSDESNGLSLKDYFSVGQLVTCRINTLEQRRAKGGKLKDSKRIGLSLRLGYLHEGLTIDVLHEGQPITACVTSIEDHGYLLTFGVPGISGFLLHQNYEEKSKLKKGQLFQGVVLSVDKKRGTVSLKGGEKVVAGSMIRDQQGLTMELLLPGSSVNAHVRAVLRNGLLLSFLTYFTGTVDMFHLDSALLGSKWREKYAENQRLKAKILYVDPITKSVGLTVNADLLHSRVPSFMVDMGVTFENAIVRRVDPTLGLLLELPSKPTPTAGYVHISNASDEHIEKLEKKFSEGRKVKARVTGFRMMDGLAIVSLKKTVLDQLLLSHTDVKPGMVVHGNVTAVEPFGAIVLLGESLKALCPLQHMSEYQRVAPSPKFQVGARLKFRVLTSDLQSKKISITHKKSLVSSKLTPITSYDDAVEGLVTHGWITGITDFGCFVSFYNDVKGLAHRTELGITPGTKAETVFQLGQCVKCRVLRSDSSVQRLSISFVTVKTRKDDENEVEDDIRPGRIVSGTIVHMKEKSIILDVLLPQGFTKGVLPHNHLSDNPGHFEQLKTSLKPGYKFERLIVLEKANNKMILSAKFSLLQASNLPSDISQLHAKAVYQGFIASITENGCFVRFLSRLTGLASIPQVADTFVADASQFFSVGQSVRAQVLEVKEDVGKFSVSLKHSVCFSTDASLVEGYFIEEEKLFDLSSAANAKDEWSEDLKIGSYVEGEIQDIKDYGVIMNLYKHKDIVGFLTHYQLGETVEVGKKVKARVLDVVKTEGIVDLTLRPELFPPAHLSSNKAKNAELKKRKRTESHGLELQAKVTALVELVKDEHLVLSLPDHDNMIAFASTRDYNLRFLDPHQRYQPGQRLKAIVQNLPQPSTGGRVLLLLVNTNEQVAPERKKARKNFKCDPGSLVEGEVISVDSSTLTLAVGRNFKGTIHITEVWDEFQEGHPFSSYQVGQTVTAKVLAKVRVPRIKAGSGYFHLELSVRPSELAVEDYVGAEEPGSRPSFDTVEVGQLVTAYVQEISEEKAWLLVGPHLRGRLFVLDSSTDPSELSRFKDRFQVGHAVLCRISGKDIARGTLDLSLRDVPNGTNSSKSTNGQVVEGKDNEPQMALKPEMILGGRVAKIFPEAGGLSVQLGSNLFGRVHITHLSDIWKDNPEKDFREGQFVRCAVLEVGNSFDGKLRIDLSLRPSLGGCGSANPKSSQNLRGEVAASIETMQDLSLGLLTQGYVKSVSKKGCFVTLSRTVDARILLSDLSDTFVADPFQSFPPGKVVKGRITSLEPLSGRVEMSLKTAASPTTNPGKAKNLNEVRLEDIHVGDILNGQIRRIENFGVFIAIESSSIVGMCHVSELSDGFVKNIEQHFNVGQNVRAKVVKVDLDTKRISLGLKESYFGDMKDTKEVDESGSEGPSDAEASDNDSDDGALGQNSEDGAADAVGTKNDNYIDQENDDLHVLSKKKSESSKVLDEVPPLQVELYLDENEPDSKEDGEGDEEDLEVEEDGDGTAKGSQRAKKRLKKQREAEIKAAEEKRLQQEQAPETVDEFEQLVRTSPDSSYVWIKYMAFMLSMADVDKAREIAERALQIINFREEGEKLNIWVAYLNLENAYGNPKKEAVLKVFQKGLQYTDPKKLYLALLGIYERTDQHDMADELLKTLVRKFKSSAKVWLRNIQNLLKRGMEDAAQKVFEQSLLSLPRRKHVKVISQVAIMEFKIGSPERARTIFEGVVRNYPKRTDLWSVYLDQEIRRGDVNVVRALFERAISLELPPKKMKFLFKKYLDFEKSNGDEERAQYVKTKAMEYVEAKLA
ncbi:unnamed protein product [Calypogeia fissa]